MQNHIIEIILGVTVIVLLLRPFYISLTKKHQSIGANFISNHVFKHVRSKGSIDIVLDGVTMTLVEKPRVVSGKKNKINKK